MSIELESQWAAARSLRDRLLAETDYLVIRFTESGAAIPDALKQYRQSLRDIPSAFASPAKIVWPEPPATQELLAS